MHLSVTNIDYNQENSSFDLSVRLFSDDFQNIIYQKYGMDILAGDTLTAIPVCVEQYFGERMTIVQHSNNMEYTADLSIKSWELKENEIVFQAEFSSKEEIDAITIENSLLIDLYFDQKNLLIISYKTMEKGIEFDIKNRQHKIKLL